MEKLLPDTTASSIGSAVAAERYRPYPAYRDSGVEWLGDIPAHWGLKRLRFTVIKCQNGLWGDEPDGESDVVCVRVADFDRVTYRVKVEHLTLRSVNRSVLRTHGLNSGDLLLEKSGGGENQPVGTVIQNTYGEAAVCSNFIARMPVKDEFYSRYLTYVHAALYAARVNSRSIKQNTGIQNLDSQSYLNESIAFPELQEQCAVATYLDSETAKIDALGAKKERLIKLLQEKRTALITRAVTKGFDPDAPMKDSGVEWLADIPEGWNTARMWQLSEAISGGTPSRDESRYWGGSIPWVSPKDMKRRLLDDTEEKITERGRIESGLRLVRPPAVLIVVRGMILAHSFPVALATVPLTINQDMKALKLDEGVDVRYFGWLLDGISHQILATAIEKSGHGTRAVRMDEWRSVELPLPPILEQRSIADFLDRGTTEIDILVAKVHEAIDRLKELRTALIAAAVTGKIDIRETPA